MILVTNYVLGLVCCIYCCICWGSWGNTQKLVARKDWSFELFYMDFTIGLIITALLGALTLGSMGSQGEGFIQNLSNIDGYSLLYALLGGIVWNFGTIFLTASMAVAGMSVGFPIGGGLGWIGGIVFNYILVVSAGSAYPGNETLLWLGVAVIIIAILLNGRAYGKLSSSHHQTPMKGIVCALIAGIAIIFFYGLVVKSMSPDYVKGGSGMLTPYTAVFLFAVGALVTTPIFNTFMMSHPMQGNKVSFTDYFKGDARTHWIGILGGFIWMSGMVVSFMGAGAANPAINYALSNAAPVVAMLWGFFIWKEFKGAPKGTNKLVYSTLILFIIGLILITMSNG
jgi:glucose uptake protein